jgi:hypothetical protein
MTSGPLARTRAGAVMLTLVCAVVTGCTSTSPRTTSSTSGAPSMSGSARASAGNPAAATATAAPTVVQHWTATHTGGGAIAAAVAAGHLWVAYSRPATPTSTRTGELVGYDVTSGHADYRATIGGAPAAVAATATDVWVANGIGDGSAPVPAAANTVDEFTVAGRRVASFDVTNPLALTASGGSAWVYHTSGQQPRVRQIESSAARSANGPAVTGTDTRLPGQPAAGALGATPLDYCGGTVYAVSADLTAGRVTLTQLASSAATVVTVAATASIPTLACSSRGTLELLLAGTPSTFLSQANNWRSATNGADASAAIAAAGGPLWLVDDQGGVLSVSRLSDTGQPNGGTLTRQAAAPLLLAAAGDALWIVSTGIATGSASVTALRIAP